MNYSDLKPGMLVSSVDGYHERPFERAKVVCVHPGRFYVLRPDGISGAGCSQHDAINAWVVAAGHFGETVVLAKDDNDGLLSGNVSSVLDVLKNSMMA